MSFKPRNNDRNQRGGYGGNRRSGGYQSGGFNRPPREMHKTTCSDCGNDTEVPFVPTEGRPVYCRDCLFKFSCSKADLVK
jgi:CxxC-x17-CxxC domain-containing protein